VQLMRQEKVLAAAAPRPAEEEAMVLRWAETEATGEQARGVGFVLL
jgi:hypothetical protein